MITLHLTIRLESCFYVTSDRKLRYSGYSAVGAGPIEGVQIMLGRQTVGKANLRLAKARAPVGRVYWITGLSGAGKTTVGRELWQRLRTAGRSAIFLDGDALREVIAEDLGHNVASRRTSAMRNARLCRMLASQGTDVVCPTISLFHEIQVWNRRNIPGYCEIYLRVPMEELRRRDAKGLYAAADRGELRDVVGLDGDGQRHGPDPTGPALRTPARPAAR